MTHPLLGREEHAYPAGRGVRVLVTGGGGSIGNALPSAGFIKSDITSAHMFVNVLDAADVRFAVNETNPEVILHLAADKHAPLGEDSPFEVCTTNITGTQNVVKAAASCGAVVVLASTCKAVEPETAYGASKLVAERIVLNAGGVVARLFNVVESSGNVFAEWAAETGVLRVTPCSRYFISIGEAVGFLSWACTAPPGRYTPDPGNLLRMEVVAKRWIALRGGGYEYEIVAPRRGDRLVEPFCGRHEVADEYADHTYRITSNHDAPARVREAA